MLKGGQCAITNVSLATVHILALLFFCLGCKNATKMSIHKNNLASEKSPYLLQHANNPVHWQAWNETVLEVAEAQQKLLIISIGYSSCHWCHVMEHESFEDSNVAEVMNSNYISIKVDREERPDIDAVYMTAAQLMTGRGGWPLNVIALPDGRPVWAGTYVPKAQWIQVLEQLQKLYKEEPEKFEEYATKLTQGIKQSQVLPLAEGEPAFERKQLDALFKEWYAQLDLEQGGANRAPKFPMPGALAYLLRYGVVNNESRAVKHVENTLEKMAFGGIYDQAGGGFARYSTDSFWKVPHFEKMLYDNAQLVSLYSTAYRHNPLPLYQQVVQETLQFLQREMQHSAGPYYSALDADSEGEEGKFYVWTEEELQELIPPEDWKQFKKYYQIGTKSLWEGKHILTRGTTNLAYAQEWGLSADELEAKVNHWKELLLEARAQRIRPGLDTKALTSWNALLLEAYVEAYKSFQDPTFLEQAKKLAQWIASAQSQKDGGLWHCWKDGEAYQTGLLEDYAFASQAFLALFEVTGQEEYLRQAEAYVNYAQENFMDAASQLFFTQSKSSTPLIAQSQEIADNVIPSANAVMALNLFKLGHYTGKRAYKTQSEHMLHPVKDRFLEHGESYYQWGRLYLHLTAPFYEVAVSGPQAFEKLEQLHKAYLPQTVSVASIRESALPLLQNRYNKENTLIFVCQEGACQLPVQDVEKALSQITY